LTFNWDLDLELTHGETWALHIQGNPSIGIGFIERMGSAHPLVEVNVSFKFDGNPSISIRFIERT